MGTLSDVQLSIFSFGICGTQLGDGSGDVMHVESITMAGRPTNSVYPPSIVLIQGNGGGDSITVDQLRGPWRHLRPAGRWRWRYDALRERPDRVQRPVRFLRVAGVLRHLVRHSGERLRGYDQCRQPGLGDRANVTVGNIFNDVFICQGNSTNGIPADCTEPGGDTVTFDEAFVTSDLIIMQNYSCNIGNEASLVRSSTFAVPATEGDLGGLGNNYVAIATLDPARRRHTRVDMDRPGRCRQRGRYGWC